MKQKAGEGKGGEEKEVFSVTKKQIEELCAAQKGLESVMLQVTAMTAMAAESAFIAAQNTPCDIHWPAIFETFEDLEKKATAFIERFDEGLYEIRRADAPERIKERPHATSEKSETAREIVQAKRAEEDRKIAAYEVKEQIIQISNDAYRVQAKRAEEDRKIAAYEVKEQIIQISNDAYRVKAILDLSDKVLQADPDGKDINWTNVFDALRDKYEALLEKIDRLDESTVGFQER